MKTVLTLILALLAGPAIANVVVYERCDEARELFKARMDAHAANGCEPGEIPAFICLGGSAVAHCLPARAVGAVE